MTSGRVSAASTRAPRRRERGVAIRRAGRCDAKRLTDIAHAAKRHWAYPERWIRLWRAALTVDAAFIARHPVYCAVRGRDVIGFYALSCDGRRFELEHMWVDPAHVGGGVGTKLFRHALRTVRVRRGTSLDIAADPNAVGFYRRLGADRVGRVSSTPRGRTLPLLRVRLRAARHGASADRCTVA